MKLRWGVLSTASIAVNKVIPAMRRGMFTEVVAIASRDRDRARSVAARLGIPKSYGSYEDLLADPNVDAIYNPLPNHLHVPWSIRALQAGKHVLCEKPIGLSSSEARQLLDEGRKHPSLKLTEGFMYKHHPQWETARQLTRDGKIGDIRAIQTFFSYFNNDPQNIRNCADIGGGALMDIGCYAISLSRLLYEAEPQRVLGMLEYDPHFKTDRLVSAILDFGRGTSTFTCSTQLAPYQRVNILGTDGRIEIEIPFNAPPDRACRIWHEHQGKTEEIALPICDQYTLQGDHFAEAVLNDTPVATAIEDSVANMEVIEAVIASIRRAEWVALSDSKV